MTDPESQESAVIQALMVRASDNRVKMSAKDLAGVTGLSRSCVQRTLDRLTKSGQLTANRGSGPRDPTMWEIAGQSAAHGRESNRW